MKKYYCILSIFVMMFSILILADNHIASAKVNNDLDVTVSITNSWDNNGEYGHILNIECANTSSASIINWSFSLEFLKEIYPEAYWGCDVSYSNTNKDLFFESQEYNNTIDAGQKIDIGVLLSSKDMIKVDDIKVSYVKATSLATKKPTDTPKPTIMPTTKPTNKPVKPTYSPYEKQVVEPISDNVKLVGRPYYYNDALWLANSASGVEFEFTGTKLSVKMLGDNRSTESPNGTHFARFVAFVDGKQVVDNIIKQKEKEYSIIDSDVEVTKTVKIIKVSESAESTCAIDDIYAQGSVKPTESKAHKIEFIGDSITCGFGVEGKSMFEQFTTATENCTKTYAYKTAKNLDAECSMVCYSGYGVVSGYTGGQKNTTQLVPNYYDKVGFSYGMFNGDLAPDSVKWDFDSFQPDVIVINLGTNDNSYVGGNNSRKEEYITEYVKFLKTIRQKNPEASIICTLGMMGDELCESMEKAVDRYKKDTFDNKVYSLRFDVQQQSDGIGACWHPSEKTHTKAADRLTDFILKNIDGYLEY